MTTMVCCCLLYLFCFILPGLPRAADQVVCKQFRAVQAGHWTGSFHLPAKHKQTACRPFNPLHVPSILFLVISIVVFSEQRVPAFLNDLFNIL